MFPNLNSYYAALIWGGLLLIVLIFSTKMSDDGLFKRTKAHAAARQPEKSAQK